jgi:ribokinase
MPTITIIGSLNIDMVTVTPRVPGPGETLTATSFSSGWGGKGANQAVAAHRLSRPRRGAQSDITVRMVGAVGGDAFGAAMLKDLEGDGLDVSGVKIVEKETTGTATILVEEGSGENRI